MNIDTTISKLKEEIKQLEELADLGQLGLLKTSEAQDAVKHIYTRIAPLLKPKSIAFRTFDRSAKEQHHWWKVTSTEYLDKQDTHITYWINILEETLNQIDPKALHTDEQNKKQYFIKDGDTYEAQRTIFKIMKRAKNSLIIVDQYLDESIFDYIGSLDPIISIKMLTGSKKPMFGKILESFVSERHTNCEARESGSFHDRFLIIDKIEVWQLGASINHAGRKAFFINKISDQTEKDDFLKQVSQWWNEGLPVIR